MMTSENHPGPGGPGDVRLRLRDLERRSDEPWAIQEISRLIRAGLVRVLPSPADPDRVRVVGLTSPGPAGR